MAAAGTGQDRTLVWLDCDPGHDDAFAIILAGHSPAIELIGVSTVAGNQSVEKTTANALRMLHAAGIDDVGVVAGQGKPLMRPGKVCAEIHGHTGLDGTALLPTVDVIPRTAAPSETKAVNQMAATIAAHHRRGAGVTIVAIACLTNVALLLTLYPELKAALTRIVLLGGAMGLGNTGPVAEFNIEVDPEAAHIVFESGVDVVMVPLEVSHTALVTTAVRDRILATGTVFARCCVELLGFFGTTYERVFGFADPPLHDPCAVAYVAAPHLFTTRRMRVDIETSSPLSLGQTVCDPHGLTGRPPNATVATAMDVDAFWDLLIASVRAAEARGVLE